MSEKHPECPLYNHANCREFYNPRLCAIVNEDKVCLRKKNKSIEFPTSLKDLKPITTEINSTQIIVQMDIVDIYTDNDMLHIETKPTAKKTNKN